MTRKNNKEHKNDNTIEGDSKRGLNEVINTSMKKRRTKQDAPSKESNLVNYSDSD